MVVEDIIAYKRSLDLTLGGRESVQMFLKNSHLSKYLHTTNKKNTLVVSNYLLMKQKHTKLSVSGENI